MWTLWVAVPEIELSHGNWFPLKGSNGYFKSLSSNPVILAGFNPIYVQAMYTYIYRKKKNGAKQLDIQGQVFRHKA